MKLILISPIHFGNAAISQQSREGELFSSKIYMYIYQFPIQFETFLNVDQCFSALEFDVFNRNHMYGKRQKMVKHLS